MQLNVVLSKSLKTSINRMCDTSLKLVDFDKLLLGIMSVSFEGGFVLDPPHKRNIFFALFVRLTITTYHLAIPKLFFTSSFFSISAIIVLPLPSKVTFRRILAISFHSPFPNK